MSITTGRNLSRSPFYRKKRTFVTANGMIARLPKLPMLIAKTSWVFLEKYPAYSSGHEVAEFAAGGG